MVFIKSGEFRDPLQSCMEISDSPRGILEIHSEKFTSIKMFYFAMHFL